MKWVKVGEYYIKVDKVLSLEVANLTSEYGLRIILENHEKELIVFFKTEKERDEALSNLGVSF